MPPKAFPTIKLPNGWILDARLSACGVSASLKSAWRGWKNVLDRAAPGLFPPELVVQVKALACELRAIHGLPLSRWSVDEFDAAGLPERFGGEVEPFDSVAMAS